MEINDREIEREYNDLIRRLETVFASESGFRMAQNYIKGLLGTAERKNGWQLAEYLGKETPYAIQQFIYRGRFSADEIRDITRDYVGNNLKKARFFSQWLSPGSKRHGMSQLGTVSLSMSQNVMAEGSRKGTVMRP